MGRRVDYLWVVRSGLQPGEVVVVDGVQKLRAGGQVVSKPWKPPAVPEEALTES